MNFHFNNRDAVRAKALCGQCACGPAVVQQTNKSFSHEEIKPINSYVFDREIGWGSFSTVYLSRNIRTTLTCAVKVYSKIKIKDTSKMDSICREVNLLRLLMRERRQTAPFFVQQYDVVQDFDRLCLVQSWCPNGQLFQHLRKIGKFPIDVARFYSAEILCALEHLHSLGIVHTALKTQNILLDETKHIKITSFGSAKYPGVWDKPAKGLKEGRSDSLYYISPEALEAGSLEVSPTSDLWAFGCLIYEMISGVRPFQCRTEGIVFRKRFNLFFYFPVIFCPSAKDLVQKLLSPDPYQRLGAKDDEMYTSIRSHPFFANTDFESLYCQVPPDMYQVLPGTSLQGGSTDEHRVTQNPQSPLGGGPSTSFQRTPTKPPPEEFNLGLASLTEDEELRRLVKQKNTLPNWHSLCLGRLILKKGLLETGKKALGGKIFFPRERAILLTLGPHLYLADPTGQTLTKEIPWGPELHVKHKNMKIFVIYTLNKKYYFRDSKKTAKNWCAAIEEAHKHAYTNKSV